MYKLLNNTNTILKLDGELFISAVENNPEYAAYTLWLSEGNTPEPADVPPAPTYQELRAAAYPPITDYLDGIVKGDEAQVAKYIADCLAVKARFPKE